MAFVDKDLLGGLILRSMSGLVITQPAAMQLQVASGSVINLQTGVTYTLGAAQSHTFSSDPTDPSVCFVALIDNGASTDIWFDEYIDTGANTRAAVPTGYTLIQALAWFSIAAGEIDLVNATINRRILI